MKWTLTKITPLAANMANLMPLPTPPSTIFYVIIFLLLWTKKKLYENTNGMDDDRIKQ